MELSRAENGDMGFVSAEIIFCISKVIRRIPNLCKMIYRYFTQFLEMYPLLLVFWSKSVDFVLFQKGHLTCATSKARFIITVMHEFNFFLNLRREG